MSKKIVIAGSGFAGVWSALAASRVVAQAENEENIEIVVISPAPNLHIRPRLYETAFDEMAPDVSSLLACVGVTHIAGEITSIRTTDSTVLLKTAAGEKTELAYDRFILATGSNLFMPDLPGLAEHSFNVDQLTNAITLNNHLKSLENQPESEARNTVVVLGAGFTGIETVLEMPQRLRDILGEETKTRVILLERAEEVGPDLGPGPRPVIATALAESGVEVITSAAAVSISDEGITTTTGEHIKSNTVIWTAGPRAHTLASEIGGEQDNFGRIHADQFLHATGVPNVFVTGDVARAFTDDAGNVAPMSCQHAMSLGRVAGHNAAAELLDFPLHPYSQPKYVTCLDLGPWGAVYTEGWDRKVHLQGAKAKELKQAINTQWIYPPAADREQVFDLARPDYVVVP